jgi:acetyl esterase/lipase
LALVLVNKQVYAADSYTRQQDVIYGRKFGMALTMDVFRPTTHPNHAGIIWCVSGGWFSSHESINTPALLRAIDSLTSRGYTVFAVVHGSQPRFTITDAVADMHRSVRFIRYHAHDYDIDPNRLGITGGSAGGHLSLMMGVRAISGNPNNPDPVEQQESRIEAVACFFPPTDFLNYGVPGKLAWETNLNWLLPPFDFQKENKNHQFILLTGKEKLLAAMMVSPIYSITSQSAPTLIIHGDADVLVPIEQSQKFIAKLKAAGVPAELIVKPGKNHGWPDMQSDMQPIGDWFDRYLLQAPATQKAAP